MSVLFVMAFRNVLRNWRHSLASLIAVGLGLVSVSLFHGYLVDAMDQFAEFFVKRSMFGHVLVEKKGAARGGQSDPWANALDATDLKFMGEFFVKNSNAVEHHLNFLNISGLISTSQMSTSFFGYAYDATEGYAVRGQRWQWNTPFGEPLRSNASQGILVGRGLAELLGCQLGEARVLADGSYAPENTHLPCFDQDLQVSAVTEHAQMNAVDLRIQGVIDSGYKELDDAWLLMPLPMGHKLFDTNRASLVGITLKDDSRASYFVDEMRKFAKFNGRNWDVNLWQDHSVGEIYRSNKVILTLFRNFVLLIVCLVGALSMSNTILRSVVERTREIGSLRALGFTPFKISMLFSLEGAFLGLIGSLAGVVVRSFIMFAVNSSQFTYVPGLIAQPVPLRIAFTPMADLVLMSILITVSACIAWIASRRAANGNIAASLTHS